MKIDRRPQDDDSQEPKLNQDKNTTAKERLAGKEIKQNDGNDKLSSIFEKFKKKMP